MFFPTGQTKRPGRAPGTPHYLRQGMLCSLGETAVIVCCLSTRQSSNGFDLKLKHLARFFFLPGVSPVLRSKKSEHFREEDVKEMVSKILKEVVGK